MFTTTRHWLEEEGCLGRTGVQSSKRSARLTTMADWEGIIDVAGWWRWRMGTGIHLLAHKRASNSMQCPGD